MIRSAIRVHTLKVGKQQIVRLPTSVPRRYPHLEGVSANPANVPSQVYAFCLATFVGNQGNQEMNGFAKEKELFSFAEIGRLSSFETPIFEQYRLWRLPHDPREVSPLILFDTIKGSKLPPYLPLYSSSCSSSFFMSSL